MRRSCTKPPQPHPTLPATCKGPKTASPVHHLAQDNLILRFHGTIKVRPQLLMLLQTQLRLRLLNAEVLQQSLPVSGCVLVVTDLTDLVLISHS